MGRRSIIIPHPFPLCQSKQGKTVKNPGFYFRESCCFSQGEKSGETRPRVDIIYPQFSTCLCANGGVIPSFHRVMHKHTGDNPLKSGLFPQSVEIVRLFSTSVCKSHPQPAQITIKQDFIPCRSPAARNRAD